MERQPLNYSKYWKDQANPKKHLDQLQRPLYANNWAEEGVELFGSSTPPTLLRVDVLVSCNVTKNEPSARYPGNHFGNGQTDKRKHLGSTGEWDGKVEKRLFHEKENQLQPIVAGHEKLQAKNAAQTIFSLQSLTQRRNSFSSP